MHRHCLQTKRIMMNRPELLHALLQHLTQCLTVYVCHQIDCGAQVSAPVPLLLTSPSQH